MATFSIVCESCGANYRLPDTFTAARAKCKKCEHQIDVAGQRAATGTTAQAAAPAPTPSPAPARSTAAPKPAPAPAPKVAPAARADNKAKTEELRQRAMELKRIKAEQNAKVMKVAWSIAGGVTLIALIGFFMWRSDTSARKAAEEAATAHRKEIVDRITANPLTNVDKIVEDLKFVDSERESWSGFSDVSSTITSWRSRANSKADELRRAAGTIDSLNEIEKKVAASPGVEVLENLFKDVRGDLDANCTALGDEFKSRLGNLRKQVDAAYLDALGQKAAADAATAKEGAQLLTYGTYEDTLRQLLDEAKLAKDAIAGDYEKKAAETYKSINGIVETLFDASYQSRVKDRDLLIDPSSWEATPSESLKFQFTGSGLVLTNEKGEGVKTGGIFFKPGRAWRDYIAEIEFKLDSGAMTFYTRIGDAMDTKKVPGMSVGAEKTDVIVEYGQTLTAVFSIIGGQFKVTINGEEKKNDTVGRALSRKGPVGIAVKAGTSLTVSKLKVRHLR
jgi:hypothetical protein